MFLLLFFKGRYVFIRTEFKLGQLLEMFTLSWCRPLSSPLPLNGLWLEIDCGGGSSLCSLGRTLSFLFIYLFIFYL